MFVLKILYDITFIKGRKTSTPAFSEAALKKPYSIKFIPDKFMRVSALIFS